MKTPSYPSFIAFIHLICIVKTDKVILVKNKLSGLITSEWSDKVDKFDTRLYLAILR